MNRQGGSYIWRATRAAVALSLCLSVVLLAGCGSKGLARVTGKVHAGGKPVTGGMLTFAPVQGEGEATAPTTAEVKSDGTFTADKVNLGKNKVLFNPPSPQYPAGYTPKPSEGPPKTGFEGMVTKNPDVEIKSGATLDIEVHVPGPGKR